ncbi:MAG TPA: sigma-54 dependent transcriptional regulator, partial [Aequorivita sp.]|nr:sigma-54 dependent transcriptional regulator [Aequorivita sp.]
MLQKENILIVDDDINILELLQRHLHSLNYHTFKAISVKEAVAILRDTEIDLLITDLKMPEVDGFQLIQFVAEHYPNIPKLVVTGYPSVQDALSAIKSGAVDYLVKPFTKEELKQSVLKSLSTKTKQKNLPETSEQKKYNEIIGESEAIKSVTQIIERVKDNKATIFISGESGTGKELVARSIHYNGKFSRAPFIAVNCGGIPENLLESELFGYVKGAFTGANDDREGFFQAADGGTIFLDEIGNASLAVQSRLLRVLQEKEVVKVGARKSEKIDLRVIAATNSNLKEMIAKETFREDLFYRLTVVEINVPPLRERKEDIPLLADKFLFKYGNEYKDRYITIDTEAKALL